LRPFEEMPGSCTTKLFNDAGKSDAHIEKAIYIARKERPREL
jgi:hypothetical protein